MMSSKDENKKKNIIKLALFAGVIIAIITLIKTTGLDQFLDKERLHSWIKGFGPWGPLVYILIYSITPSLFLPGLPVTIAGGLAFGPVYGTLFAIVGATIGACLAFLVARYFARSQVECLLEGRLKKIDEGVEKKGWIFVAITRLIPIFPFNLLNYAFGLTKIKFSHYAITSFICMLPATAAYVVLSSSLLDLLKGRVSPELIIGVVLLAAVSSVPFIYNKLKK
ncbi:MAG: TVP38/TMEM64 family protein [Nitrospinota bacterium]|nr:TVP38/TMEM64 family protein [Nitrospinota bacterium]